MKIFNISIENFKGIEHKKITFDPAFNVLIGDNGAGKTSILDAVSIAMGTVLMKSGASFGHSGTKTRPLYKHEIRNIISENGNKELLDVTLSGIFVYEGQEYNWLRKQPKTSKNLSYKEAASITSLGEKFSKDINTEISLPLFVHHTTGRLWGNIYDKKPKYKKLTSRFEGYYACLDSRSIKDKFLGWFKTYEDEILKFEKNKSLYVAFTTAITSMIKDWSTLHYSWEQEDILGKLPNGNWMPLRNLSDGYRGLIYLTADLAYRAIQLNPHLGENAVKETRGIVLIDEIDMHLHPIWQRHIVEDLKNTFPNLQFIVTTHSPFIVQSLKAAEVINLDENILAEDPDVLTIEQNALFMGVPDDNSKLFVEKEKFASEYLHLLSDTEINYTALDKLENYFIAYSDDPAFVAKLKYERLIRTKNNETGK